MGWFSAAVRRIRIRRSNVPPVPEEEGLDELERRIGYRFRDRELLINSLKHRSYVYAHRGKGIDSNERMEFLGDAVLDLLVADFLFQKFPDRREGDMTQMKSLVVSRPVLARKAHSIDLGRFVLLSPEERQAGGDKQPSILCDTFEALIGAVYLDGGLEVCRSFVERNVLYDFDDLIQREDYINFKSKLLEHTQSKGDGHPRYLVHAEEGPDHCKLFSVDVCITGRRVGHGQGRSKKEAQQMAAKDALRRLGAL